MINIHVHAEILVLWIRRVFVAPASACFLFVPLESSLSG